MSQTGPELWLPELEEFFGTERQSLDEQDKLAILD
jgi:hypothetical protein